MATQINVSDLIDQQRVGKPHIIMTVCCFVLIFLDGFDTLALGVVAPALSKALNIEKSALGPIFSAGVVGLMLGHFIFGGLADRIDRKYILIACTAGFGITSLLMTTVGSTSGLLVVRFLTGLGLGAALPNTVALLVEYSPRHARATLTATMNTGLAAGAAAGGLVAAWLVPSFGWQSVFYVGGFAPLLILPILMVGLPRSVSLLVLKKRPDAEIARLLTTTFPKLRFEPHSHFRLFDETSGGLPVLKLFGDGRALMTALVWVCFICTYTDLVFLQSWLVIIVNNAGVAVSHSALAAAAFQIGGICGGVSMGLLCDRFGFGRVLGLGFIVTGALMLVIGWAGSSLQLMFAAVFFTGLLFIGGIVCLHVFAGSLYPPSMRSSSLGWAMGVGRFGSIAGPLIGGALIASNLSGVALFAFAAVPSFVTGIVIYAISRFRRLPDYEIARPSLAVGKV